MNCTIAKSRGWLIIVGGVLVLMLLGVGLVLYHRECIERQCSSYAASLCSTETPPGRIAFIKNVVSSEGIYTMDPNGNNIARLTSAANCVYGQLSSPVWSPDGQTIAFGCQWPGTERNLCLVESQASRDPCPVTNLLEVEKVPPVFCTSWPSQPATSVRIDDISWAPDGRQLVFTCPYPGESRALVCTLTLADRSIACWPIALVSGGAEVSGGQVSLDWNPVYAQLALGFVLKSEGVGKIYLADLDGQNGMFLAEGGIPSWSPDGERLLFFHRDGMHVIDRSGHKRQTLYQAPDILDFMVSKEPDRNPLLNFSQGAWSPDQQFIVFSSGNSSGSSTALYRLDLTKKAITRLTIMGDGEFHAPDWLP